MNMFSAFYSRQFFVGGQLQSAFEERHCPSFLGAAGQKVVEIVNTQLSLGHMHRIGLASRRAFAEERPAHSSTSSGQLDSSITRSAGICHPGHFYSGICYLEIFIFGMTFMALSSSLCMKTLKLKVTVSKFSC